jgi:CheY-like chemotaxis protein
MGGDALAPLVLLVEDVAELRETYAEVLRDAGMRVAMAADGIEGVDAAIALQPDVIVMDVSMPRRDGLTAVVQLRGDARTRSIPVILCTSEPVEDRARQAGCGFLRKPCSLEALVAAVQAQIGADAASSTARIGQDRGSDQRG